MNGFEKISKLQDEILGEVWDKIADKVDVYYVQGKISSSEDGSGMIQGGFEYAEVSGELKLNTQVGISDQTLSNLADYIIPRIQKLHDELIDLQGKSPVRFRWVVDVKTGHVDSEWTYLDQLTPKELENNAWKGWRGDEMWEAQILESLAQKKNNNE